MAGAPLGIQALRRVSCRSPGNRTVEYRVMILILTFICYTSYHLSRKPLSVIKSVLHQNCTGQPNCTSWPPFDGENYKELLGSLDYAFLVPYAIGMFISGQIAERMDLRYFLTIGMVSSGVFTALLGLGRYWQIHSLGYFIAIQVCAGLVSATGWPSVVTCVANWFGKGKRGFIMGVWNSHTSVGNILGSVIAGIFVSYDWGLSFIVPGIIIAGLGIVMFFFLVPTPDLVGCDPPDHGDSTKRCGGYQPIPEFDRRNSDDKEELLSSEDVQLVEPQGPTQTPISFSGALKIPGVVEFALCLFFAKLVSYTFLYWLPIYIGNTLHYNPEKAADMSTFFDVGGIFGGILAGLVSDITGGRATVCATMLAAACPMLFIYEAYGSTSGMAINIVMLLFAGGLVNGPYALITTAVSADLGTHPSLNGNSKALATVTAIIDGTGSMGAALGPLLTGLISPTGWKNVFYMLIVADACALLVSLYIRYNCDIRRLCIKVKVSPWYVMQVGTFLVLGLMFIAVMLHLASKIVSYEIGK